MAAAEPDAPEPQPAGEPVVPQALSTRPLPPAEQHAAWSAWFQPVFDVRTEAADRAGFPADYVAWPLDPLTFTTTVAPGARSIRTAEHVRRSPVDHWVITYCPSTSTQLAGAGHQAIMAAGKPFLWTLGEATDSFRLGGERQQLYLPREAFADIAGQLDAAVGSTLDTPLGALLGDLMCALPHRLPGMTSAETRALSEAIRTMVVACVAPSAERLVAARPILKQTKLAQIRRIIHRNLRAPQLGPQMLCREAAMSRSSLYRLLEPHGGVARFIQQARLRAARRALCDLDNAASVAQVAEGFCFSDPSAFARAFRREFGHSPQETRAAARIRASLPGTAAAAEPGAGRYLDALSMKRHA